MNSKNMIELDLVDTSKDFRFNWSREEILEILNMPLIDLMWKAQIIHRKYNDYKVQREENHQNI